MLQTGLRYYRLTITYGLPSPFTEYKTPKSDWFAIYDILLVFNSNIQLNSDPYEMTNIPYQDLSDLDFDLSMYLV